MFVKGSHPAFNFIRFGTLATKQRVLFVRFVLFQFVTWIHENRWEILTKYIFGTILAFYQTNKEEHFWTPLEERPFFRRTYRTIVFSFLQPSLCGMSAHVLIVPSWKLLWGAQLLFLFFILIFTILYNNKVDPTEMWTDHKIIKWLIEVIFF